MESTVLLLTKKLTITNRLYTECFNGDFNTA